MYSEGLVLPVIFLNIRKIVTNFGDWSKKTWNYSIFKDLNLHFDSIITLEGGVPT